ncbi:MAG TPA: hypothetical protein VFS43_39530 [Polyangiaceae bacterium]|nr:hypothetical protein [Polyangiaceae bacterium]
MRRRPIFLFALLCFALPYAACGGDANDAAAGAGGGPGAGGSALAASGGSGGNGTGGGPGGSAPSGGGTGGAPPSPTGLPCAVESLLRDRCQLCHGDPTQFGAPMPLVTRDDLLAPSFSDESVSTASRVLARMRDGARPMPPPPNDAPTSAEVAVMQGWVADGMPGAAPGESCGTGGAGGAGGGAGGSSGGSGGSGGGTMPGGCTPDISLKATSPYQMPEFADDRYVCFSYELPAGPKRHIIAAAAAVDDTKIVHHLIAFQVPAGQGPGTTPVPCSSAFPPGWKMIYGWGPGGLPLELPAEAGFPTEAGAPTRFVVQVHYSNLTHEPGHSDQTAINLCSTAELRPNDADVVAFGGISFSIGAGKRVRVDCQAPASLLNAPGPVKVFRAWPHMHKLGESFLGQAIRAGGATSSLGAVLNYDFEHQLSYAVDATLAPGDVVKSSCTWDNTLGTGNVGFGEATSSEMCFNFLSYYPRAPVGSALSPAFAASCSQQNL